jgi:chromate transport protein ChrA
MRHDGQFRQQQACCRGSRPVVCFLIGHSFWKQFFWELSYEKVLTTFYFVFQIGIWTFAAEAMLPMLHRELIDNRHWIDERS